MIHLLKEERQPVDNPRARVAAGFHAALIMLALMFLGRLIVYVPIIPELMADWLFAWLPISLVEFGNQRLGINAQHLGFVGCVLLFIVASTYLGAGALWLFNDLPEHPVQFGVIVFAVAFWYVSLSLVIPGFAIGIFTTIPASLAVPVIVLLAIYLIYGVSLGPLFARLARRDHVAMSQSFERW